MSVSPVRVQLSGVRHRTHLAVGNGFAISDDPEIFPAPGGVLVSTIQAGCRHHITVKAIRGNATARYTATLARLGLTNGALRDQAGRTRRTAVALAQAGDIVRVAADGTGQNQRSGDNVVATPADHLEIQRRWSGDPMPDTPDLPARRSPPWCAAGPRAVPQRRAGAERVERCRCEGRHSSLSVPALDGRGPAIVHRRGGTKKLTITARPTRNARYPGERAQRLGRGVSNRRRH